jgi:hypothetical protein
MNWTWYADGVGIVKDSTIITEGDCEPKVHVSKLIDLRIK